MPGLVFPLSLLIAAVFALLGWAALSLRPVKPRVADHVAAGITLLLAVALFPLAQVGFFGTSDYRA